MRRAYHYTQGMILDAIHRSGTFVDIGCANGHLMEMLSTWLADSGRSVEFYGLDISPELVALAKQRLPLWKNKFFIGKRIVLDPRRLILISYASENWNTSPGPSGRHYSKIYGKMWSRQTGD